MPGSHRTISAVTDERCAIMGNIGHCSSKHATIKKNNYSRKSLVIIEVMKARRDDFKHIHCGLDYPAYSSHLSPTENV